MVVLLEVSPISTQDLCSSTRVTIGFLVTSLTEASSRKSPGLKLCPFKNYWRPLCSWEPSMQQNSFVAFPRFVPRPNPVSELHSQFLQPHGLVFALICIVSCETLYSHGQKYWHSSTSVRMHHSPRKVLQLQILWYTQQI